MGYNVNIKRLPFSAIIDLQGEKKAIADWCGEGFPAFPNRPNTASTENEIDLYWIGLNRWLLRAEMNREEELFSMTKLNQAPANISIVQISDTLQFFSITGEDADDIISIASPLDHHCSAFPDNGVSYTDVSGIKGIIIRKDAGFEIAIERSFGDMIEDFLTRTVN